MKTRRGLLVDDPEELAAEVLAMVLDNRGTCRRARKRIACNVELGE